MYKIAWYVLAALMSLLLLLGLLFVSYGPQYAPQFTIDHVPVFKLKLEAARDHSPSLKTYQEFLLQHWDQCKPYMHDSLMHQNQEVRIQTLLAMLQNRMCNEEDIVVMLESYRDYQDIFVLSMLYQFNLVDVDVIIEQLDTLPAAAEFESLFYRYDMDQLDEMAWDLKARDDLQRISMEQWKLIHHFLTTEKLQAYAYQITEYLELCHSGILVSGQHVFQMPFLKQYCDEYRKIAGSLNDSLFTGYPGAKPELCELIYIIIFYADRNMFLDCLANDRAEMRTLLDIIDDGPLDDWSQYRAIVQGLAQELLDLSANEKDFPDDLLYGYMYFFPFFLDDETCVNKEIICAIYDACSWSQRELIMQHLSERYDWYIALCERSKRAAAMQSPFSKFLREHGNSVDPEKQQAVQELLDKIWLDFEQQALSSRRFERAFSVLTYNTKFSKQVLSKKRMDVLLKRYQDSLEQGVDCDISYFVEYAQLDLSVLVKQLEALLQHYLEQDMRHAARVSTLLVIAYRRFDAAALKQGNLTPHLIDNDSQQ